MKTLSENQKNEASLNDSDYFLACELDSGFCSKRDPISNVCKHPDLHKSEFTCIYLSSIIKFF